MANEQIVNSVRRWLDSLVVALTLCPFAQRELENDRVRFVVSEACDEEQLLVSLEAELEYLDSHPAVATTLLIHPRVLHDFFDYNQFLQPADGLLTQMKLDGIYQIASFHPDYQFAGTDPDDAENYTNRSPYPMLHIIREESLARAIAGYPDVEQIPAHNIAQMKSLGREKLQLLLQACIEDTDT